MGVFRQPLRNPIAEFEMNTTNDLWTIESERFEEILARAAAGEAIFLSPGTMLLAA